MTEEFRKMNSAVSDLKTLNGMARSLERSEARRIGTTLTHARKMVARRLGITAATFENILYQRTKNVPSWLMNKVREELVSVLQSEMRRLEHEIQIARQTGADNRDDALIAAETQIAAAREILDGEMT
jgi:hypothetical protein